MIPQRAPCLLDAVLHKQLRATDDYLSCITHISKAGHGTETGQWTVMKRGGRVRRGGRQWTRGRGRARS